MTLRPDTLTCKNCDGQFSSNSVHDCPGADKQRIRPQDERLTLKEYEKSKHKCGNSYAMPGPNGQFVRFTCTRQRGHETTDPTHYEQGRVRSRRGNVSIYTIVWQSLPMEVWRQE